MPDEACLAVADRFRHVVSPWIFLMAEQPVLRGGA
jgi:hypothetical protein